VVETEQARRERLEQSFWTNSEDESPGARSLDAFTNKMSEARIVLEKLDAHREVFEAADVILEIGAGQGWTSCIVRHEVGADKTVFTSDIAPDAVASFHAWERTFGVELDGGFASRSYELPVRDASVDLVFVFAAAHHFGAHRRTLVELARVLRPGAQALYVHEPGCRRFLHRLALRRVMAKRPVVAEDVLVYRHIQDLARQAGLETKIVYAPTTTYRGPIETFYYYVLQRVPALQRVLPCTVDFVFTKPRRATRVGSSHRGADG
jgi:ubiquinone/menaquinone biosynthesis C-methylase UbiE